MTTTVSFDLDGTLIVTDGPVEPLGFIGRIVGTERLRLGTRRLFGELNRRGTSISIYTTSLRSHWSIRSTFRRHGLRLDRIVNGDDHRKELTDGIASKRPDRFGFALHVDDAPIGLEDIAKTRVIVVDKADRSWVDTILNQIGTPNQALLATSLRSDPEGERDMKAKDEIPQEFFNNADLFVRQANTLLKDWPRSRVSAALMYATARFNAYNWLFREVDLDQTKEQAVEFYTSQYREMFLDNVEQLWKSYTESGDLDDKGHPTIASRARSARSGPRAPEA